MSVQGLRKAAEVVREAAVTALYRQWRGVGAGAAGRPSESAIVDPEGLILGSLCFREVEPRLWTVMTDWLRDGARLISVQRIRNLTPSFTALPRESLVELAQTVLAETPDARWKSLAAGAKKPSRRSAHDLKRRSGGPIFDSGPTLVLRFRAAFGVGLKADLLAFLLSSQISASVSSIAKGLGYSVPPVFRGLQDLVAARFARTLDKPAATEYALDALDWRAVIGPMWPPYWRPWKETFSYAAALGDAAIRAEGKSFSDYASAVRLRELAESWSKAIERSGVFVDRLHDRVKVPTSSDLSAWLVFNSQLADEIRGWL